MRTYTFAVRFYDGSTETYAFLAMSRTQAWRAFESMDLADIESVNLI